MNRYNATIHFNDYSQTVGLYYNIGFWHENIISYIQGISMLTLQYHHIGIPTDKPLPEEDYNEEYKLYASGYFQSPYGVEWMKFDPDCPLPELVKTVPHVAFEVDDLEAALEGHEVIIEPNSPSPGLRVAFILHNGAPVEFLSFAPAREAPEASGQG